MQPKAEYIFFFEGHIEDQKVYVTHIEQIRCKEGQTSLLKFGEYYDSVYEDFLRHRTCYSAMVRAYDYTEAFNILNSNLHDTEIILQTKPLYNLKQPYEDPNTSDERIS